jgi:hypothetical protein
VKATNLLDLVRHELSCGDGEDVVELLERPELGLRKEEEDEDEGDDVETGLHIE